MKKYLVLIFIITFSFINSCNICNRYDNSLLNKNYNFRERYISPPINDSTNLAIEGTMQLYKLMDKDSIFRAKVKYIYWEVGNPTGITNFILKFPNLQEIEFQGNCSVIMLNKAPKSLKSIIIDDSRPIILNLSKFEFVEIIKYHCSYKDSKYFDILKDFKHLNHLVLYLPYITKSLDKDIINLDKLEKLDLLQSEMKTIPKAIKNMKSLNELTVDSEQEIEVPKCILEMKSLKVLNIIGNDKYVEMFNKELKDKYPNLQVNSLNRYEYYNKIEYYSEPNKK